MSSPVLLASVVDNGDAAVLASTENIVDAGTPKALLDELMRTGASLGGSLIRIVTTPDEAALGEAAATARAFSAAGYPVDAIVVTRVPAARDGWPKTWAEPQRARVDAFITDSPVPVLPLRLRPQRRMVPRTMVVAPIRAMPDMPAPEPSGEHFTWSLPVDGIASVRDLGIGQGGGHLVIRLDGREVRRPLPSVLTRCLATKAEETASGVTITFERDARVWPQENV